ncbi:MAG TPA: hypothetical protein VGO62_20305, partial [Myxococcota bacterium]
MSVAELSDPRLSARATGPVGQVAREFFSSPDRSSDGDYVYQGAVKAKLPMKAIAIGVGVAAVLVAFFALLSSNGAKEAQLVSLTDQLTKAQAATAAETVRASSLESSKAALVASSVAKDRESAAARTKVTALRDAIAAATAGEDVTFAVDDSVHASIGDKALLDDDGLSDKGKKLVAKVGSALKGAKVVVVDHTGDITKKAKKKGDDISPLGVSALVAHEMKAKATATASGEPPRTKNRRVEIVATP